MSARLGLALVLAAANAAAATPEPAPARVGADYYGTLEPFAAEAIYFVVTDRYVDGDPSNDHRDQGGAHPTFDIPLRDAAGKEIRDADGVGDNLGYLGGDFKGIVDNAAAIRDMGFTSVWVTPIVDNPDQAFTGGDAPTWGSILTDRGKAGYHGYWGTNFYKLDEHLPSAGLDFRGFTGALRRQGLKVVLDIVCNHGSPAFGMPQKQPQFGQIFAADGSLLADHGNLPPDQLDPEHVPLQRFYRKELELAQLSNLDDRSPAVLDYLAGAYLQWIEQGAAAFRVDTIRYMPPEFWKKFAARIRAKHPGFFMFGESFDYEAKNIAGYTRAESGNYSVLDFPLKAKLADAFGKARKGYETLEPALYLEAGPYRNPYDLVTFYDNHDMARLDADDNGFIDAHNWLFTARGIPAVYYGSETGFMRGRAEHQGNRNYYGQERVDASRTNPIRVRLKRIADARAASPALQRGLQLDLEFSGDRAAFYRVWQRGGKAQTALVLLNKGDAQARYDLGASLQPGTWRNALDPQAAPLVVAADAPPALTVGPHDVAVWLRDAAVDQPALRARLDRLMARRTTAE